MLEALEVAPAEMLQPLFRLGVAGPGTSRVERAFKLLYRVSGAALVWSDLWLP